MLYILNRTSIKVDIRLTKYSEKDFFVVNYKLRLLIYNIDNKSK